MALLARFPAAPALGSDRTRSRAFRRLYGVLLAGLGAGCATVGIGHRPPEIELPASWTAQPSAAASADPATFAKWWTTLNDSALTRLVERAVSANLDAHQAVARVFEARARRGIASAELLPRVTATASETSTRSSGTAAAGTTTTLFALSADASWEVDLFGRRRNELAATTASLQASVEDVRDVLVTLTADVALNYIDVRLAQARLATANENLALQTETHEIAQFRFQAGLVTQLDVDQARLNLEQTRASIPPLRADLAAALNRLAVLLGQPPGALKDELAAPRPIPSAPVTVVVGLPADVLRRRPDVRRAERDLVAQSAQVAATKAERYSSLSLIGSIGLDALSPGKLVSSAARTLVSTITGSQNVFDAGRIRQNIDVQSALEQQAAFAYETSVLVALEEVENALVAFAEEQARRQALISATEAARSAVVLANERYRSGLIDFEVVLIAQRALLTTGDELTVSTGAVTSNLIRVYRAAGGGWTPLAGEAGRQ